MSQPPPGVPMGPAPGQPDPYGRPGQPPPGYRPPGQGGPAAPHGPYGPAQPGPYGPPQGGGPYGRPQGGPYGVPPGQPGPYGPPQPGPYGPPPMPGGGYGPGGPQPSKRGGGGSTVAIVLGTIGLIVLLLCGGVVGVGWWAISSVKSRIDDEVAQAKQRAQRFRATPPRVIPPRPPAIRPQPSAPPASVSAALSALKTNSRDRIEQAADYLATAPVDTAKRSEVAATMADKLKLSPPDVQRKLLAALAKWGGAESVPELVNAVKFHRVRDQEVLRQLFALLGKLKHPDGIEVLASHLPDSSVGDAAAAALKEVGPTAQLQVAKYVGHPAAGVRARGVLASYGIDADAAVLTSQVAMLEKNPKAAAESLATIAVVPDQQTTVARALDAALANNKSPFERQAILRALKVWGDKESIKGVAPLLSDNFCRNDALAVVAAVKDPASAALLTPLLGNFFAGDSIAKALQDMGPEVKPYVLEYLNDGDGNARRRARTVLATLEATSEELLTQTVKDLKSPDLKRQRAAVESLAQTEVDEKQQAAVAEELARLATSGDRGMEEAALGVLARWGTKEQGPQMIRLLESRDRQKVEAALDTLLAMDDPKLTPSLTQELARLLKPGFMKGAAVSALTRAGPKAEDVLIGLLGPQFTQDVISAAVPILANVGTQKSLSPLARLADNARKARNPVLAGMATSAQGTIRKRLTEERKMP